MGGNLVLHSEVGGGNLVQGLVEEIREEEGGAMGTVPHNEHSTSQSQWGVQWNPAISTIQYWSLILQYSTFY